MPKRTAFILFLIFIAVIGVGAIFFYKNITASYPPPTGKNQPKTAAATVDPANIPPTQVLATGLEVPWALAFLPDQGMLFTERPGRVRYIDPNGIVQPDPIATFSDVVSQTSDQGEDGLLGLAVDPNYVKNHYVFFYYTYKDTNGETLNRVVRYQFMNLQLSDRLVIVDAIPGNYRHDGGRLEIGPDGYLYITTGDSLRPSLAQDKNALAGKILRVTRDGKPAPGNPFSNDVYSYGHRNPQGLAWDSAGQLYEVEHGDSAHDEINSIKPGNNYGWSIIQGDQTKAGMITPLKNSENVTWAPSGMTYLNGVFYFAALKGEALFKAKIDGSTVTLTPYFQNVYGRIRAIVAGPDGLLYMSTSNRDGRNIPGANDDLIIRINPAKL